MATQLRRSLRQEEAQQPRESMRRRAHTHTHKGHVAMLMESPVTMGRAVRHFLDARGGGGGGDDGGGGRGGGRGPETPPALTATCALISYSNHRRLSTRQRCVVSIIPNPLRI